LSERASSITIGADNMTGGVRFVVTQTFRTVTVQWKISNIVFGDHVLEWEFDNNLSQEAMWEQIQRDLYNYQMNKMYK
jgi:hypothetical protein